FSRDWSSDVCSSDLRLRPGGTATLAPAEGHTVLVVVLEGTVMVNDDAIVREGEFALLDRTGGGFTLEANGDATVLVLAGEPIDETAAMQGPLVMNTADEIRQ